MNPPSAVVIEQVVIWILRPDADGCFVVSNDFHDDVCVDGRTQKS
jgi:hypothetical protein